MAAAQTVTELSSGITRFDPPPGVTCFGKRITVEGGVAAVGANCEDIGSGNWVGAVYVFRYDGSTWHYEARLTPVDTVDHASFGLSLDVSVTEHGERIIVGEPRFDGTSRYSGEAHIFVRDDTGTWKREAVFDEEGFNGDSFGRSVAIEGTRAVVGALGFV